MEEDIKILQELKEAYIFNLSGFLGMTREEQKRKAYAIENLIKGYRELEEREIWSTATITGLKKDFIPNSKIQEKIKQLVIEEETGYFDNSRIIRILQELMEDK